MYYFKNRDITINLIIFNLKTSLKFPKYLIYQNIYEPLYVNSICVIVMSVRAVRISEEVFNVEFCTPEARITLDFISDFHKALDEVEKNEGDTALVISNKGKFFSNGLHFETLANDPPLLLKTFHKLMLRILTFPVPTIAAINGHAFAGGAMISICCDYRIMNKDKGFYCINEVDIGLPLTPGMARVVTHKVNRSLWPEMILNARRFSGPEAFKNGIVNAVVPDAEVLTSAIEFAKKVAHRGGNKPTYAALKEELYRDVVVDLKSDNLGRADLVMNLAAKL